jgi:type IX secretion system PorP/SprF family membrane protein
MPEANYRAGITYRQQWASIPVPYNTFSAFADFQVAKDKVKNNWLGLGVAFWNDKAGAGSLQLTKGEAFVAYHLQLGEGSMISGGASVGFAQRSVDFSKFVFDRQWDGFQFDGTLPSGEPEAIKQTSYADVGVGLNYAWTPNENFYLKIGAALAHINQPRETFYNINSNVGMRPTGNVEAIIRAGREVILTPSVYFTRQRGAQELLYGVNGSIHVYGEGRDASAFIIGAYHRMGESVIGMAGYQYGPVRFVTSYDYTLSDLRPATNGRGAMEFSIVFEGLYTGGEPAGKFNCPRF